MAYRSTLAAGVAATDTTITVTSADGAPPPQFRVAINAEIMQVVEGPPGSTTWTVIRDLVAEAGAVVGGDDWEGREATDTWGASSGWRGDNTDASFDYSVTGGVGRLEFLAASSDTAPFLPLDDRPLNVGGLLYFAVDALPTSGDDNKVHLRLREQDITPARNYRIRVTIKNSGDVDLRLGKQTGGVQTVLGSLVTKTGLAVAGHSYYLRLECVAVSPTTLRAKMWDAAGDEPSSWDVTTTDSEATLQAAGDGVALRFENTGSAVIMPVYSLFDLQVYRVAGGVTHANGDDVVEVEPWDGPLALYGHGAPVAQPATGALYVDVDTSPPTLYVRVGSSWYSETLT